MKKSQQSVKIGHLFYASPCIIKKKLLVDKTWQQAINTCKCDTNCPHSHTALQVYCHHHRVEDHVTDRQNHRHTVHTPTNIMTLEPMWHYLWAQRVQTVNKAVLRQSGKKSEVNNGYSRHGKGTFSGQSKRVKEWQTRKVMTLMMKWHEWKEVKTECRQIDSRKLIPDTRCHISKWATGDIDRNVSIKLKTHIHRCNLL